MSGHNRCQLFGNLGQDPELRHTQEGTPVMGLRMATTEVYFTRDREKKERTDWHTIVVWGKRAEALAKILKKGDKLFVEGSIRNSSYEDRDGNTRYKSEVSARSIVLSGKKQGTRVSEDTPEAERAFRPPADSDRPRGDDDIPF